MGRTSSVASLLAGFIDPSYTFAVPFSTTAAVWAEIAVTGALPGLPAALAMLGPSPTRNRLRALLEEADAQEIEEWPPRAAIPEEVEHVLRRGLRGEEIYDAVEAARLVWEDRSGTRTSCVVRRPNEALLYQAWRDGLLLGKAAFAVSYYYHEIRDPDGWPEAPAIETILADGVIEGMRFPGLDFSSLDLAGIRASRANLEGTCFYRANLAGADFHAAGLRHSDLRFADLRYAVLQGADPEGGPAPEGRPATRQPAVRQPPRRQSSRGAHRRRRFHRGGEELAPRSEVAAGRLPTHAAAPRSFHLPFRSARRASMLHGGTETRRETQRWTIVSHNSSRPSPRPSWDT
jgi:hypothetical protein